MASGFEFATERLRLRPFEERDREPFCAMNQDPAVMRYFGGNFPPEKSAEHMARYRMQLGRDGFSILVVESRETGEFLGVLGMQTMLLLVPGLTQPAVELGWRLVRSAHGFGYATEGARAVMAYAFGVLGLREVVAITAEGNAPSRHVMEKLGMRLRPELAFEDPRLPVGHVHRASVLYSAANPLVVWSTR